MPGADPDFSVAVPLTALVISVGVRLATGFAAAVGRAGKGLWERRGAERKKPGYIPNYALAAPLRWWYFTVLAAALRPFPQPVWRVLALTLAAIQSLCDGNSRVLSRALLAGLGGPVTFLGWWRLHWHRCYETQSARLLLLQADRLTTEWAREHVRITGCVPPGGAILVCPHHEGVRIGLLALAGSVGTLGTIPSDSHVPADLAVMDATRRTMILIRLPTRERTYGDRVFPYQGGARKGLHHLMNGGTLVQLTDNFWSSGAIHSVLGRRLRVARGTVWLAERTGKPILPILTTPEGRGWRLAIGAPIPPTQEAVVAALEAAVRRAPGSWESSIAMQWMAAPLSGAPVIGSA